MTLEEIKSYFSSFSCEVLTSSPDTEAEIKAFSCKIWHNTLENYFKTEAWNADKNGETRFFVARAPLTKQIIFFFSLKCGSVFTTHILDDQYRGLSEAEKSFVNMIISSRMNQDDKAYYELVENGGKLFSPEVVPSLIAIADHRSKIKDEINEVKDAHNVMMVHECYSAIEIQHICRSDSFKLTEGIDFPLGFGLFWQVVVQKVIEISNNIGCEYLFLFAADRSENPDDRKLITYYKSSLRFRDLDDEGVILLKSGYDYNCIGLLQNISDLTRARDISWQEFSDHVKDRNSSCVL